MRVADKRRQEDGREARARELMGAMREYLTVHDLLIEEMRQVPTHPKTRIGEKLDQTIFGIARGTRIQSLIDRLSAASSHLRLIAPAKVDELMQNVMTHAEDYSPGDDDCYAKWKTLRAELRDGFKAALDA
jgi:hypothetical protein